MKFNGKIIAVTGGGSGIGQACCQEFARRGGAVAVIDWDEKSGASTAQEISQTGAKADYFRTDVASSQQVEETIRKIVGRFGGIDVLVNNAGIQRYGTATTTSEAEWDQVLNVNLKGAYLMCRFAIPEMVRRGGGAIVNTGSVQSATAQRNSVAYVVSKHALLGLTRAVALDFARENIRCNCVMPGAIDTPMLRWAANLDDNPERVLEACRRLHMLERLGTSAEVAQMIAFLASDLASFVTGAAVPVDGGLLVPTGGMMSQESGTGAKKA